MRSLEKYQQLFIEQRREWISQWTQAGEITESELFRFLHTIKGTAGTIGLGIWSERAANLEEGLDREGSRVWGLEQVRAYLGPIIELLPKQEQETSIENEDFIDDREQPQSEHKPLVLLVDDDIELLTFLKEVLEREDYMVVLATSYQDETIQKFYEWKPDCVILDVRMPEKSGFEILSMIEKQCQAYHVPIIMMSADSHQVTRKRSLGVADDFLSKPIDIEEFIILVNKHVKRRKELSHLILVDRLTGLFNQRYLTIEIERQLNEWKRSGEVFTLVYLDVDHFGIVNKNHGYSVADSVLVQLSNFIKEQIRPSDTVARLDGDKWVLVLPRTTGTQAHTLVMRIFQRLEENPLSALYQISLSARILEVDSQVDSAESCFEQLPFPYHEEVRNRTRVIEIIHTEAGHARRRKKLNIAVIDDDSLLRAMLSDQLMDIGGEELEVDIRTYTDGEEFFMDEWHQKRESYFLIVDGIMPKMDGLEVLQKIRQEYPRGLYTIMMLTSRNSDRDVAMAIQKGADDYLTKPFGLKELQARVRRLIRGMK